MRSCQSTKCVVRQRDCLLSYPPHPSSNNWKITSNYQDFSHPLLGSITITGGYMEPDGHSLKPELKAIFLDGTLKTLPPAYRNIGIDYVVSDRKVKAWYGGTVTAEC